MMTNKTNHYILFLLLVFFIPFNTVVQAQTKKCATVDGKVEWLKKYQTTPAAFEKTEDVIFVPLTIHVVGTDEGTGFFGLERTLKAFCTLNQDFESSNIHFFIEGDLRYIYNSAYASHTFENGWEMMQQHNVANTINCYIVEDPAGACGYSYYSAGIALKKTCISPGTHTWAHELGHYLSLPHPFYGWEGEIQDFTQPAPDYIGDTEVERVDGSNCSTAADGFCDTPADYISDRWQCNDEGLSGVLQTDPLNETFRSDGSFFMSYANDACSNRFSEEQVQAMRANLNDDRPNLLYNQTNVPDMPNIDLELISPVNEEVTGDPNLGIILNWEPVPNATHYIVQANPFPAFSYVFFEFITTEPNVTVFGMEQDRNYYWRVKPYSNYSSCIDFSETGKFKTGQITTDVYEPVEKYPAFNIYPNPLSENSELTVEFDLIESGMIQIDFFDSAGKRLISEKVQGIKGNNQSIFSLNKFQKGVYLLRFINDSERLVKKIVIQ